MRAYGWGHSWSQLKERIMVGIIFRLQLKEKIMLGLYSSRNYKGAFGCSYFPIATIRVTMSDKF